MMKDFIKKHKTLSWVLGIFGALIVGGLGSGVWEVVLKPIFSFLGNGIITFLINKSTDFSNEIYQIISIRSLDRYQAKIYSLIVLFLASSLLYFWLIIFLVGKKRLNNFIKKDNSSDDENSEDEIPWTMRSYKNFYCFIALYFLMCCIPLIGYTYDGMKTKFISEKVIHFEYLLKINGDILDEKEIKGIESKFAQIRNAKDYKEIIDYLENIASKNEKTINKNPL